MAEIKGIKRIGFRGIKEEVLEEIEKSLLEAIKGEGKPLKELIYSPSVIDKE